MKNVKSAILLGILLVLGLTTLLYIHYLNSKPVNLRSKAASSNGVIIRTPDSGRGWLTAVGTKLVDEDGKTIRFTGTGMKALSTTNIDLDPTISANIAKWGFNQVRIEIVWGAMEPTAPTKTGSTVVHTYDPQFVGELDQMVTALTSKNVRVIFSIHPHFEDVFNDVGNKSGGMPAWLYPNKPDLTEDIIRCNFYKDVFGLKPGVPTPPLTSIQDGYAEMIQYLANKYKDNPMVSGIDMINEPYPGHGGACTFDMFRQQNLLGKLYQKIGTAVRQVNPKILLIFEEVNGYNALNNNYTLANPPPFSNIVYAYHLYPTRKNSFADDIKKINEVFLNRAKGWNVPLWMGEFMAFSGGSNSPDPNQPLDPNWIVDLQDTMTNFKDNNVGWNFLQYVSASSLICKDTTTPPNNTCDAVGGPKVPLVPLLQGGMDTCDNGDCNPTPPITTVTPPITTTPPIGGGMKLNLSLAFQGITSAPAVSGQSIPVAVSFSKDGTVTGPESGTFTFSGSFLPPPTGAPAGNNGPAIWTGSVSFPDATPGDSYTVFVKGPMHLQKKICEVSPHETVSGTYSCSNGTITLAADNTFDFSGVINMVGDLDPQNGIVDSYDISLVRNNLGSKDAKLLSLADLNFDGLIDSQDYSLMIASLSIKSDEQ